jgi:hypothetical protein
LEKREFLPKRKNLEKTDSGMEFTSFIAADDEELGKKKTKTSQKVVNSAS